jgi:hypothetical protein
LGGHGADEEAAPELDLAALGVGVPFGDLLQVQVDVGHPGR